jgi:hypothetical protein
MRNLLAAAALSLIAPLAAAQNSGPIIAYPPQNDTVSLSLALEDWVETQSARTELAIDASLPGSDAGKVRNNMLEAVKSLAQGVEWRFTTFDRSQDASGLEHWHAVMEARLPEAKLGGLSDRAKQASKPGLQINVQDVDFTPTLEETQAARFKLRGETYKKINEALTQLNQAEPDRKFRISNVDFGGLPNGDLEEVVVTARRSAGMPMAASAPIRGKGDGGQSFSLSEKVKVHVDVTFSALAPRE